MSFYGGFNDDLSARDIGLEEDADFGLLSFLVNLKFCYRDISLWAPEFEGRVLQSFRKVEGSHE